VYQGHVEATFESAHKADVPGHKCSGTLRQVPKDVREALYASPALMSDGDVLFDIIIEILKDKFDYHGHSWLAEIDFEYTHVDEHFWGPDFGKVKDLIRVMDHHNLNLMFEQPTSEFLARFLYESFEKEFGFAPLLVRLHEGRGNKMEYRRDS